jgi:hypothetical protein
MDSESAQVFKPCGHACCCNGCAKQIITAKMDCPLCRSPITKSIGTDKISVHSDDEKKFQERKSDYISQLKQRCAKNAGYTGNSKMARGVGSEMGDAMEEIEKERAGEQRYSAGKETSFEVVNDATFEKNATFENGTIGGLRITYKVGKKMISEMIPYFEWESTKSTFVEKMTGDTITVLDMASHYPEDYWLWRYHQTGNSGVENALQETGLLQPKRRRR